MMTADKLTVAVGSVSWRNGPLAPVKIYFGMARQGAEESLRIMWLYITIINSRTFITSALP